jgi:hypothetical protein
MTDFSRADVADGRDFEDGFFRQTLGIMNPGSIGGSSSDIHMAGHSDTVKPGGGVHGDEGGHDPKPGKPHGDVHGDKGETHSDSTKHRDPNHGDKR